MFQQARTQCFAAHGKDFAAARVGDLDFLRRRRIAHMLHPHGVLFNRMRRLEFFSSSLA